jgi:hypothetical protein
MEMKPIFNSKFDMATNKTYRKVMMNYNNYN